MGKEVDSARKALRERQFNVQVEPDHPLNNNLSLQESVGSSHKVIRKPSPFLITAKQPEKSGQQINGLPSTQTLQDQSTGTKWFILKQFMKYGPSTLSQTSVVQEVTKQRRQPDLDPLAMDPFFLISHDKRSAGKTPSKNMNWSDIYFQGELWLSYNELISTVEGCSCTNKYSF